MDTGLPYGFEQIADGWTKTALRNIIAALSSGYHHQHNTDDTHATITASGPISERGRTVAMGDWTDYQLNAAWYSAVGSMTWTVNAGSFWHLRATKIGSTLLLDFRISGSTLGGSAASLLRITLPEGLVVGLDAQGVMRYINGTSSGGGEIRAIAGNTYIQLARADGSNWDTGSTVDVMGQIAIPISSSSAPTSFTTITADYLLVGGGGGGSSGAGGGGSVKSGSLMVTVGQSLPVTVGGGGAKSSDNGASVDGSNGGDSVFNGDTAHGGGGGAFNSTGNHPGKNGGCGGGGGGNGGGGQQDGGSSTDGQGNGGSGRYVLDGVTGYFMYGSGGGGGAGANGTAGNGSGGNGGNGLASSITGSSVTYGGGGAGGGGGAAYGYGPGSGGTGGGGQAPGLDGTNGLGGGGCGVTANSNDGVITGCGKGGSGVVIIRYFGPQRATGGSVTTSGNYTIHTFTSSGTFAL